MRILTLSWEFPPAKNGGLGVACYGLTKSLLERGLEVLLVLPKTQETIGDAHFIFADTERLLRLGNGSTSYFGPYAYHHTMVRSIIGYDDTGKPIVIGRTLIEEAHRYAHMLSLIVQSESFDVIHAHDWTSYLAGIAAKIASGKKLIVHVHATSYDQSGGNNPDPEIFKIEQEAFAHADSIVTVSHYTKNIIIEKHGADPAKIDVVHNGSEHHDIEPAPPLLASLKAQGKKIVIYHGRISIQKGVPQFIKAARRVADMEPNVLFVVSGSGDMWREIVHMVGEYGLSGNVLFAGALWERDRDSLYQAADLCVMPSVSEPFGLVPLEALRNGTPSVITKQSGVGEVLTHALKVDFWDVDEMANQIVAALRYPKLREQMVNEGRSQLVQLSWQRVADKVLALYHKLVSWLKP
jgi:glycosyltransferase involved in cell wall biosynthesis